MVERRPNPKGWVPPKAPYNPYDPADQRPPEGYPSEYKTPGSPRNWTMIPKEPTNYRQVKEKLKRLNYTPRPLSEYYPGQYKVLKRKGNQSFNKGVRLMAKFATWTIVIGSVFFYRWNDGYDNVFSTPYRWQLWLRERLFSNLSPQQKEDLEGKQKGAVKKTRPIGDVIGPQSEHINSSNRDPVAFERPSRAHVIEAERIMQEREEALLRAVDIAKQKVQEQKQKKGWFSWN